MHVDEWADQFRFMNEATREKWYTDRMEVARGPMRAVTQPGVRTITVMCATQLLKTELILNTLGYFVDLDPCPILVVQPKEELAKKFSHIRLKQMIKSTPRIRQKFVEEKAKDSADTALYKEFTGGQVAIVSAKTPGNLAMLAIRLVFLDEIDKYDESSGKEGDPVDLAEERMSKYSTNSLSIRVCSPTIKDQSRIEESYNSSDRRKPFVKCPHCNHKQVMVWKNVRWNKDESGNAIYDTASYCCEGCGVVWSEYDRIIAIKENMEWYQTAEFTCRECNHKNKPSTWNPNEKNAWVWNEEYIYHAAHCENCGKGKCPDHHAGFWANKIYGQFRALADMCRLFIEAQGNIEKLKMFINTQLAETFEEASDKITDVDWLMKRREKYMSDLPDEVGLLTAGIDTQNNRLEIEVIGWGMDEESWSIEHKVIPGDPALPETWQRLDEFLNKPFFRNDGRYTFVAAAAIDMQGGHTQHVANYCRFRINRRIWPIRGMGGDGKAYPVWPRNPSRTGKHDTPFYNVGVDSGKNVVFSRLLLEQPGAGYCHFPHDRSEDWFKQLVAEKRTRKFKGTRQILVWENTRKARNEAFDCRVYGYAALCGLQAMGWNLNQIVENQKLLLLSDVKKSEVERNTPVQQKKKTVKYGKSNRSNFMSR